MCGISGCIVSVSTTSVSTTSATSKYPDSVVDVLDSVEILQNRGYDSAGIGYVSNNLSNVSSLHIVKHISSESEGAVKRLRDEIYSRNVTSNLSIAHTRWATHGDVSVCNAHPHYDNELDSDRQIILVHNGIIENYRELRYFLEENYPGVNFYGSTDSEVVAKYIRYMLDNCIELHVLNNILEGSWAILFVCADEPDKIFYLKNGSPLLIGFNVDKTKCMMVSEMSGFSSDISEYLIVRDSDCGYVTHNEIHSSFDNNKFDKIDLSIRYKQNPLPYNHWTLKEIYDQPSSVEDCLRDRFDALTGSINISEFDSDKNILKDAEHIIFLACGTSYHAAKIGANYFMKFCPNKTVDVIDGADFEEYMIPQNRKTAIFVFSQSGETKDLIRGVKVANNNNIKTIGLINVEGSCLSRMVDICIYLRSGRENAVASTKCFINQVLMILLIALNQSNTSNNLISRYIDAIRSFSIDVRNIILLCDGIIPVLADKFDGVHSCFILGRHIGEYIALEGALKIKEISYVHAEGYSSSALKHGPFALLTANTPVIIISPNDDHASKNNNATQEIKSRGAPIIQITNMNIDPELNNVFYYPTDSVLFDILSVIPIQLLAYRISINRKINPDLPRNLAKVVTVE